MDKIAVIMSTYNGETYLREQMDTIFSQQDISLHFVIRDDGSSDKTKEILSGYKREHPTIDLIFGETVGCKKSFYEAARYAYDKYSDVEYFAFSDQDDFWLEDKLCTGIKSLKTLTTDETRPLLYFCPPRIVDQSLRPIGKEWSTHHYLNFEEACLAQACAGCTMVFNRRALELFLQGSPDKMSMHDSWLYKTVLACGGRVYEDTTPHILYRQHSSNVIGTGSFLSRWKRRYHNFMDKNRYRSGQVKEILHLYRAYMSPKSQKTAEDLSGYGSKGLIGRIRIASNPSYRTSNPTYNLLFKLAVVLNRY